MQKVKVSAMGTKYDIFIDEGIIKNADRYLKEFSGRKAAVVSDATVADLYFDRFAAALRQADMNVTLITVLPGEASKSQKELFNIYSHLTQAGITRADCIVALGGGVIGDMAGFAAATYLRGVDLIQVPTTLLAQVDSSVGGKTAINLPEGKNLVGAFCQPRLVLADTHTLTTLSKREVAAGLAEVIKYGVIIDEELFCELEKADGLDSIKNDFSEIVAKCCRHKAMYVKKDPLDKGCRMELNFGHTLGHAIENAAEYGNILHGEGVAIGMAAAAKLGERMGITQKGTARRIKDLLHRMGLEDRLPRGLDKGKLTSMQQDKKGFGKDIYIVLLEKIGKAHLHRMKKEEAMQALLDEALV